MASKQNIERAVLGAYDILRGKVEPQTAFDIIAAFTLICRMDRVLAPCRQAVRRVYEENNGVVDEKTLDMRLRGVSVKAGFYNTAGTGLIDSLNSHQLPVFGFEEYVSGFSPEILDVLERVNFGDNLNTVLFKGTDLFYGLARCLLSADIGEDVDGLGIVSSLVRLRRKVSRAATPGLYYSIIESVLFRGEPVGNSVDVYDPACGDGDLLRYIGNAAGSVHDAECRIYGQDADDHECALAGLFSLILGVQPDNIRSGDIFNDDHFGERKFRYCVSHVPSGRRWDDGDVRILADDRFSIGIPARTDSQILFIEDLISKMDPDGARAAFITNASPLYAGGPKSGENKLRKWLVENDLIEMILALPKVMGQGTSESNYLWVLSNKKKSTQKGRIHFIDLQTYGDAAGLNESSAKEFCEIIASRYEDGGESFFSKVMECSDLKSFRIVLAAKADKRDRREVLTVPNTADLIGTLNSMGYDISDFSRIDFSLISELYSFKFTKVFSYLKPYPDSWEVKRYVEEAIAAAVTAMREFTEKSSASPRLDIPSVEDPWYRRVPNNWTELTANCVFRISKGVRITGSTATANEGKGLSPVLTLDYLMGLTNRPRSYAEPRSNMTVAMDGDTLLVMSGARTGETVKAKSGIVGPSMAKVSPVGAVDPRFLFHLISAMRNRFEAIAIKKGRFGKGEIGSLSVFLPDLDEQKRIASYLDETLRSVDSIARCFGVKIRKLEEFRLAITYEAVTGKISV